MAVCPEGRNGFARQDVSFMLKVYKKEIHYLRNFYISENSVFNSEESTTSEEVGCGWNEEVKIDEWSHQARQNEERKN